MSLPIATLLFLFEAAIFLIVAPAHSKELQDLLILVAILELSFVTTLSKIIGNLRKVKPDEIPTLRRLYVPTAVGLLGFVVIGFAGFSGFPASVLGVLSAVAVLGGKLLLIRRYKSYA